MGKETCRFTVKLYHILYSKRPEQGRDGNTAYRIYSINGHGKSCCSDCPGIYQRHVNNCFNMLLC